MSENNSSNNSDNSLFLAAFVCNLILGCIFTGWILIPLAWMIPMTVRTYKIYKGKAKNTVAFGVCCLIFVSLVGGILLLCAPKAQNENEPKEMVVEASTKNEENTLSGESK